MPSPTTPTFLPLCPPRPPDGYEENISQLELVPIPSHLLMDMDELSESQSLTPLDRGSSLAHIHTLGTTVISYLYYADQHLSALRLLYIDKHVQFKDPLRRVFDSFVSAHTASFLEYRKALAFYLRSLLSSQTVAPVFRQYDEDGNLTSEVFIDLYSFLQLRDEINTLFHTPLEHPNSNEAGGIAADLDITRGRGLIGVLADGKYQFRQVFFTTPASRAYELPDVCVKIPIHSPEAHAAFWAHLKAIIPTLLATLPPPDPGPTENLIRQFHNIIDKGDQFFSLLSLRGIEMKPKPRPIAQLMAPARKVQFNEAVKIVHSDGSVTVEVEDEFYS
ncbi:hypothetical protein DV735_g3365, partial [Chaetothyriales sp. CBS 134920]